MKILWTLIALLLLGAAVALAVRSAPHGPPGAGADLARNEDVAALVKDLDTARGSANGAAPTQAPLASPASADPGGAKSSQPLVGAAPAHAPSKDPAKPALTAPGGVTDGMTASIPSAEITPGNLVRQSDGSIIADGKYRISGAGSKADPYRVSWECLASAQETYLPRLGETKIPQRIAMLDEKFVRIEGYIAFPLAQTETREILVMLNQWDGCCVGVPPTPYDAMEVKLLAPIANTRRHASFTYGTVTGKLKVEPYLVENWLVGLYVLDEATFSSEM